MRPAFQSRPRRSTILLVDDDPFLAYSRKLALEKSFGEVERVRDAAEAFIRLDEPPRLDQSGHANRVGLVVVSLHQPGISGPEFAKELCARFRGLPVLALGRADETALDYCGDQVCFLPRHASMEDLSVAAGGMLAVPLARIA